MKTMRHIQTWLLITLLALSASNDVWGKRLETNWNGSEVSESQTQGNQRGYTDHEHLDSIGLIHMNGRVYDPKLARFISPDPYIQDPYNTQSFNRYSYVWNNPLRHTDPTGEFIPLIIAGIKIAGLAYGVYEAAEVARGIATGEITGQEAVTGAVITAGLNLVGGAAFKTVNKVTPPVVEEQIKDVVDKALRKNTDAQQNLSDKPTRTADAPDGRGGNNDVEVNDNVNGDATKETRVFHRRNDPIENIEKIKESGELRGNPPTNVFASDIPKVQAFDGPLSPGQKGFEFTTPSIPDKGSVPGRPDFSGNNFNPTVETRNGQAVIKCTITKVFC